MPGQAVKGSVSGSHLEMSDLAETVPLCIVLGLGLELGLGLGLGRLGGIGAAMFA